MSIALDQDAGKKIVLKDFVNSFHSNSNAPKSTMEGGSLPVLMGLPGILQSTVIIMSLNCQGEIKMNGKPCHVPIDSGGYTLYVKPHSFWNLHMGSQEN